MHLKRQETPKRWPIPRKGTVYVARPFSNLKSGIPLLIVLRDMLKIAQRRKEVERAIYMKNILVNGKIAKEDRHSLTLFDVITVVPSKKHYRVEIAESGKFEAREISEKESHKKTAKIINKKILKEKKTQLNLSDGSNMISEMKCNVNDSVEIDFKNKKIEKCLPLKDGAKVVVFEGKHAGKKGMIEKINAENKTAELESDGKKINVLIKQLLVTE